MNTVLLLSLSLPLAAQIVSTNSSVRAQSASVTCTISVTNGGVAPLVSCAFHGVAYPAFAPAMDQGMDFGANILVNGDAVAYSLTRHGTVISWWVAVKPNTRTDTTRQSGIFSFPLPVSGLAAVGTLVNSVCQTQATGFHPSLTGAPLDSQKGPFAVMLPNEIADNCLLPGVLP